jgi:hypothetical protein
VSTTKDDFTYEMCVVGQLTPRQKIMTSKLLRESDFPAIAMDEVNAKNKEIKKKAKYLVIFSTGDKENTLEGLPIEWPVNRILIEEEDFPLGSLPQKENNDA